MISRRTCLMTATAALAAPAHAKDEAVITRKVTPKLFDAWLEIRGGLDGPAFWYSEGLVRPIADGGKVAARMLGVETWVNPPAMRTPTSAVSLSRKIFFYLEPDRDEISVDAEGKPLRPAIYTFQVRKFTLRDEAIQYEVESHDLNSSRHGGAGVVYTFSLLGDQVHVNYGSFPVRAGGGAGEIYDYFDNGPRIASEPARYQMAWVGTNTEGRINNMHGWRFSSFEDVPNAWLKTIIREKAPLWMAPPTEMAEVEKILANSPYRVPALGL